MHFYILALLIGITSGLRALTALAAVSWFAYVGWLPLENTFLAFMGFSFTPYILTLLAIGELVADQLPQTPRRTLPLPFIARIVSGAFVGAALGITVNMTIGCMIAGIIGSVIGTFGGYALRKRLVKVTAGKDAPIAYLEDLIAIGGAIAIAALAS